MDGPIACEIQRRATPERGEISYCAPSVWLCVIALAGRYPSAARVHLAHLREGVAWVACLAGLARVRTRVRAYEDTPHRLAEGDWPGSPDTECRRIPSRGASVRRCSVGKTLRSLPFLAGFPTPFDPRQEPVPTEVTAAT